MARLTNEIVGWYGTVAIVLAYALVSFYVITSNSILYQLLNLTGALGIILISVSKRTYQPAALNIMWAIIALIALSRIIF
jgi:uncharacterized YccA/Bax inhibitor family protein